MEPTDKACASSEPLASASLEFEHQSQRLVDVRKLVDGELADEVTETFWGDSGRLLNKHLRWLISDFDRWPKGLGR